MCLVHSARLKGHEPHAYLKDVMERLPTQPASRIGELLPHHGRPVDEELETLIDEGGDISIGPVPPFECVAAASDGPNCLAMLVRRDGESLGSLLRRLDQAIALAWSDSVFTDEINNP